MSALVLLGGLGVTGCGDGGPRSPSDVNDQDSVTAAALGGVHQLGYREILIGDAVGDHRDLQVEVNVTEACQYARLSANNDLLFLVVDGELARIDISGPSQLPNGLGVGSSANELQSAFGDRLTIEPNKYDAAASDYVVRPIDNIGLLFEVSDNRVTRYRVGRLPEVNWVEGCL